MTPSGADFETSYKPPVLESVTGADDMPTTGGATVSLVGRNFGPVHGVALDVVRVTYGRHRGHRRRV